MSRFIGASVTPVRRAAGWMPPGVLGGMFVMFCLFASPGVIQAQSPLKIGFVNVGRVLDTAPQAAAARNRIEREFAPRDRQLLDQQKRLRTEEDKLVKDAAVISASERQRKETELRALKRELRRSQDEFREDLNLRRSQELSKLQRKVADTIRAMAKAEQYDLVITDGAIYAGERVDFTARIVERLESEFKGE